MEFLECYTYRKTNLNPEIRKHSGELGKTHRDVWMAGWQDAWTADVVVPTSSHRACAAVNLF